MALTLTKLTQPDPNEALLRERLFTRLDAVQNNPVVLNSTPAGAGKATLASPYIESKNDHSLWYQVDKGDANMATCFHYLKQAVISTLIAMGDTHYVKINTPLDFYTDQIE